MKTLNGRDLMARTRGQHRNIDTSTSLAVRPPGSTELFVHLQDSDLSPPPTSPLASPTCFATFLWRTRPCLMLARHVPPPFLPRAACLSRSPHASDAPSRGMSMTRHATICGSSSEESRLNKAQEFVIGQGGNWKVRKGCRQTSPCFEIGIGHKGSKNVRVRRVCF